MGRGQPRPVASDGSQPRTDTNGAWAAPTPQGHLPGAPTGLQPRVASARASVGAK